MVYVSVMSPEASGRRTVAVYCAASPTDPELLELAASLGAAIAQRGWTLVWGGGHVSAMGAVASAARAHGGWTVGVIPQMLMDRELADHDSDELIVTGSLRERKQVMEERADAFIALPGGVGTLDELLSAWTEGYLGVHEKPIVILDPWGHYDGMLAWIRELHERGYVTKAAADRLIVVDKVGDALQACVPA